MENLYSSFILVCFSFATGIFTVLSFVEKPVWSLMLDPHSKTASDEIVRTIHAQLKRVIHLLPPTMMVTMLGGGLSIFLQAYIRQFDLSSIAIFGVYVACLSYLLTFLKSRIDGVDKFSSEGEINTVRIGLGKLAAIHHVGLFTALSLVILQFIIIVLHFSMY